MDQFQNFKRLIPQKPKQTSFACYIVPRVQYTAQHTLQRTPILTETSTAQAGAQSIPQQLRSIYLLFFCLSTIMDDRSARFEDKIKNARSRSTQQQQKLRRTKTADSVLTTTQKGESSGQRRRRKSDKKTDILSIMSSSCSSMTTGTPTTAPTTKKDRMDTDEIIKMLEDYASNNNAEALQAFHSLKMGPDEGLRLQQQQRQRSTRRLLSPPKHANTSGAKTA